MMFHSLSNLMEQSGFAIANHLWQSTLFACGIALLTLGFRRRRARIRYHLWLAASIKFLFPFAWLTGIGGFLAGSYGPRISEALIYTTVQQVGQPFSPSASLPSPAATPVSPWSYLLLLIWLAGSIAVFAQWLVRRNRVQSSLRYAPPSLEGRDFQALRRLQQAQRMRGPIPLLSSPEFTEPAIFGVVRPRLLWPTALSERLDDAQLESILAHELCHVRHRDNLAATLHLLVEALFWFHPLVWWLGARMVAERERACDEEVLCQGNPAQSYAEGLLRASAFCVAPLVQGMSGITGSNLEKRIERIMTQKPNPPLMLAGKVLLAICTLTVCTAPILFGIVHAPAIRAQSSALSGVPIPALDSISIKPHPASGQLVWSYPSDDPKHFKMTNCTLKALAAYAYGVHDFQITGGPEWTGVQTFDIEATVTGDRAAGMRQLTPMQQVAEKKLIAQTILAEKFHLRFTQESEVQPAFALEVSEGGAKLAPPAAKRIAPDGEEIISQRVFIDDGRQQISTTGPISVLADLLADRLQHPVINQTGLSGTYEIPLAWSKGERENDNLRAAVQDQLGLVLSPVREPVEILTIQQVEQPLS